MVKTQDPWSKILLDSTHPFVLWDGLITYCLNLRRLLKQTARKKQEQKKKQKQAKVLKHRRQDQGKQTVDLDEKNRPRLQKLYLRNLPQVTTDTLYLGMNCNWFCF